MKNTRAVVLITAGLVGLAAPAAAQTASTRWSLSFDLGAERSVSGDVHAGGSGTVLALPTQVESRSYQDIYGAKFAWAASFGYAVTEMGELRVRLTYAKHEADRVQVGNVAGLPLFGLFDDDKALGVDFGYRQYLGMAESRVRPFVGAQVGFVNVDTINAEFTVPAAGVTLSNVDFYESTTAPAFGFHGGVEVKMNDRFALQGGVDLRWRGNLTARDGLAGTGLEPINDESARWSLPFFFGATVRF